MRISIPALALIIGTSLSGCMGSGTEGAMNRSLESVHQPIVREANYALDVTVSNGIISPTEMRKVSDWFDAMDIQYGDRVSVDETASGNARAARDSVAMLVARRGLLLADHAPVTSGALQIGAIRVVITRSSAHVPGCPDWSSRMSSNFGNNTSSNYGCAINANLAAMVADATDLVSGQGTTGNDPLTASRAINTYREAEPTGAGGLGDGDTGGSSGGGQ